MIVRKETFVPTPDYGVATFCATYPISIDEPRLLSTVMMGQGPDLFDQAYLSFSEDNGDTWGDALEWECVFDDEFGVGRRVLRGAYCDPYTGRSLLFWNEGVLPNDRPEEGMMYWTLHYGVIEPGGESISFAEQVVYDDPEYDEEMYMPRTVYGRNCVMAGWPSGRPVTRPDGVILVPVQASCLGSTSFYNPCSASTYTDCLVLMGVWREDGSVAWTCSERIEGNPRVTRRGLFDPTIAYLDGGPILMVMSGSNQGDPMLDTYKWMSRSADGGSTWSQPEPWTYVQGRNFFSSASPSQLLRLFDGRLVWVGSICRNPADDVDPSHPLLIGQVDSHSGLLIRSTCETLDERLYEESQRVRLANVVARQDGMTGEIVVHTTRLYARAYGGAEVLEPTADGLEYRVSFFHE